MPRIDPTALENMFLPKSLRPQVSGVMMDFGGFNAIAPHPMSHKAGGFEESIALTRNKLPDNILTRRERFEKAPIDKMLREASFPPKRWTPQIRLSSNRNFDRFGPLATKVAEPPKPSLLKKTGSLIDRYMKYAFGTG